MTTTDAPPTGSVVIEDKPASQYVRRPADTLRFLAAMALFVGAVLLAWLARRGIRTAEDGLIDAVIKLPADVREVLNRAVQLTSVGVPAAAVAVAVIRRRRPLVGRLALAAASGFGATALVGHLLLARSHPAVFSTRFPTVAWLSGLAAMATVAAGWLSRPWRRTVWWLIGAGTVGDVLVGVYLPMDAAVAAALGVAIGSLVALLFGGPASRPAAEDVLEALEECGIDVVALREVTPAPAGPSVYAATTTDDVALTVRVLATDDRDRDWLIRLYRWLATGDRQDDRALVTVESAAEHELLAMVSAARAGARVPDPVVAYPVGKQGGRRGALLAWVAVGGRRLDLFAADQISDQALADLWRSAARLQQHRLAHRMMRTDHLILDGADRVWIGGLALAELGAAPRQLAADLAELLASLATQVGVHRSVASALAHLGPDQLKTALPYLQPLAMVGTTLTKVRAFDRTRLGAWRQGGRRAGMRRLRPGGRPDLLADPRDEVAKVTATSHVGLEKLSRFSWKKALTLVAAFAVLHLVLPQLTNIGAATRALRHADWWWVLAAAPATFLSQAMSTLLQMGTIPTQVPFRPTFLVQLGGSFLNRVTPNNVGGTALNVRYLQKAGVDTGGATASAGLQWLLTTAGTVLVTVIFLASTGRRAGAHIRLPGGRLLLTALIGLLAAAVVLARTPRGRRLLHDKAWPFLTSAATTIAEVASSPHNVALAVTGVLAQPVIQILALSACAHGLGGHLTFVQVGSAYMGARLLASVAPVPGGLGVMEAALIAALAGLGMVAGAATSAVLIYRLLTFWLNIPVGWAGLKVAEKRGYV